MKEKQPYEKPKMTFIENQSERRKNLKKEKYECAYMDNEGDLQESYRADYSSMELAFDLKNITLKMTSNQRDILKYLILGWSDSEIASFLHFSRQYVNREKKNISISEMIFYINSKC